MGAICSSGFGSSCTVRVDCPLEFVWECIADFEHYPRFLSSVIAVECIDEKTKLLKHGTRWRETRKFLDEHYTSLKTVTCVEDHEKGSKLVSIHTGFTEAHPRIVDLEHSVYTCTLVVTPTASDKCELHGSYAAVYGTWGRRLLSACYQCYLPKDVESSFEHELNEMANEAVARYRLSLGESRS